MLSKIPFQTGSNEIILENLRAKIQKMHLSDRCCALMFDASSSGFHYEVSKQQIYGFEDLGHLGDTSKSGNHALILMLRDILKSWKQVIAYYVTANTVSTMALENIIITVISCLQKKGFNVMATICDQSSTNRAALVQLYSENIKSPNVQIYFKFFENKQADFDHITTAFNLDKKRMFNTLPKLKNEYFKFKD